MYQVHFMYIYNFLKISLTSRYKDILVWTCIYVPDNDYIGNILSSHDIHESHRNFIDINILLKFLYK